MTPESVESTPTQGNILDRVALKAINKSWISHGSMGLYDQHWYSSAGETVLVLEDGSCLSKTVLQKDATRHRTGVTIQEIDMVQSEVQLPKSGIGTT